MLRHSIIIFLLGWVLWFAADKHPAALGVFVPAESDSLLNNFQLAFDMAKAGYLKASFVYLWKAHFIVLALVAGLISSLIFQIVSNTLRRRRLRAVMRPEMRASDDADPEE